MNPDTWYKTTQLVLPAVIAVATIYISVRQLLIGHKTAYREDYKFAKAFFEDLQENPNMHAFVRHKGYQALLGNKSIPTEVIEMLVHRHDSVQTLSDYSISQSYIKHTVLNGKVHLEFESKFWLSTARRRRFWVLSYSLLASTSYVFTFIPALAWSFNQLTSPIALSFSYFTVPLGMISSVLFVRKLVQLLKAIRLLKNLEHELGTAGPSPDIPQEHD